jgi:hypothetical protein
VLEDGGLELRNLKNRPASPKLDILLAMTKERGVLARLSQ